MVEDGEDGKDGESVPWLGRHRAASLERDDGALGPAPGRGRGDVGLEREADEEGVEEEEGEEEEGDGEEEGHDEEDVGGNGNARGDESDESDE